MSAGTAAAATAPGMPVLPANPIDYPIMFVRQDEEEAAAVPPVTLFTALQWLLPVFQLAGWLSKHIGREGDRSGADPTPAVTSVTEAAEVDEARRLLPHFEPFFTSESRVIPNGALLYTVQTFRFPTPRGPRSITRALVETPAKYFSPLQEEKGGGHFLCCYEDRRLLRHFTYVQLDQLRFAWVAVKELLEEHKAVQRTDGALTGLARRDIKKNNSASAQDTDGVAGGGSGTSSKNPVSVYPSTSSTAAAAALPAPIAKRPHPSSNVITGPTAEARKTREEMREKKYMSDLLRDECAARWPHTPVHKSVIFVVEEQQQEAVGGRKGRKGPRTYLATVELPLLNKKGGTAAFRAPQWCTTRRDAENAAAEVALRALRSSKSEARQVLSCNRTLIFNIAKASNADERKEGSVKAGVTRSSVAEVHSGAEGHLHHHHLASQPTNHHHPLCRSGKGSKKKECLCVFACVCVALIAITKRNTIIAAVTVKMIQSIFSVAKTMLEKEDKSKKGNTTAPTDSSNDNAAPRPTVQGGEGRAPSPANPASNEQHREEPQEPGQREEEGGRQQQQDNSCKEENGTAAVEAQEEKTETKREETKTSEDAVPPVTDERSIAQVLAVVDGTEPTQRFQAQEQQPSCTPDMPPAEVAVSSAVEANASNNSAVDPSNSKQQQSEEELESQKHESHQQQHAAVPVMPHHVFSEEEVAALMEKRRLREQALQEEQRQAASKRSSVASASSTRRSLGDASGWRNTSVDANAARVSLPPFYAAAAAPGSAPLAHPLAHQPLYPRASLASPAADVPLPPPPPYPHIIAADDNAALKSRPHTQQPQPQAVCGPWGFQPQFMGFPHVYGAPAAFDPASMLLNAQQQQQQPGVSDPSASILAPPPVQPNGMGMSMQELGVLARLIVLAQNNPQQQQQQQNFFPPQLPLPQQQQQQQYYYYYPQRGRQENVTHFVNPLNQQPVATHIKVDPLASSSNLQDSAPPTNVVPMLEKDVKLVAAPVTEHQNSTQV